MVALYPHTRNALQRALEFTESVVGKVAVATVLLATLLLTGCAHEEYGLKEDIKKAVSAAKRGRHTRTDPSYVYDPQSLDVPSLEAKARKGNAEAAWQLYAFADLPEADAWKWLCLAANGKYAEAQNELGRLYWYGVDPVKEDRVRGYMWYKLAARRSKSAAHEVKELQHELTAEQLAEVKRLVATWKPAPEGCQVRAQQKT